jgi:hypothetical protein
MCNSLDIKNCEPFTMKHMVLFIDFTYDSYKGPRSWIPHDPGGSFSPPPLPRGGGGRLSFSFGGDHGGQGWLSPSTYLYSC